MVFKMFLTMVSSHYTPIFYPKDQEIAIDTLGNLALELKNY